MEQNEKNSQKAQELTKEELEQVNGGNSIQEPTLPRSENIIICPLV